MRSSPSGGRTLEEEHVPVLLPVQRHVCQDLDELPAVAAHRVERPLELAAIELVLLASQKPVRYHARRVLVGGHAPSLPGRARCRRGPVGAARAASRHRKPASALWPASPDAGDLPIGDRRCCSSGRWRTDLPLSCGVLRGRAVLCGPCGIATLALSLLTVTPRSSPRSTP